jgi:hypothetical protein
MSKKASGITVLFFAFCISNAQTNDAGLWLRASVEKKINLQMSLQLSQGLRMYENLTEVGQTFTELGFSYLIKKGFTASVMYRFSQSKQMDNSYSLRHRAAIDLAYKYKYKRAIFIIRERVQIQYRNVGTSETGNVPRIYARTKFTFKYDLKKKITPYVAIEMYNPLNNPKRMWIDKLRYRAGLEYDVNKHHSLDFYGLIDQQLYRKNSRTDFVGGIGYKYSF